MSWEKQIGCPDPDTREEELFRFANDLGQKGEDQLALFFQWRD
jgi:hypothetical protein